MKKQERNLSSSVKGKYATLHAVASACMVVVALVVIYSCSSIDCPLNNRVYTQYALLTPSGVADTMKLSMTISTNRIDGEDSVLINKDENFTAFSLPISNGMPRDSFFVELASETASTLDTIIVGKEDRMHFESTDCAPSYFHNLLSVSTTHHAIDSVVIKNHEVNYDTSKKHFNIYFTPRD